MGHAFIRKVHVLYQRGLRKYPGNVGLWLDFATFCFSHGNARLLSEVTSQGLRLNPSCAGLWCFAANWEYKHKGDISAARRLLLRGLRNCAQSKVLWQVYFRLELKVAADVRARNEALGLPAGAEGANPGAVAEAVFEAPRRAHPRDRVFHTQFVTIAAQHDWACELKRDMTLALTREFRRKRRRRRRGGAREPPVCAGASRRRRRVVRRAGVRRRRGRDREGLRLAPPRQGREPARVHARGVRPGRGGPAKREREKDPRLDRLGAALRAAGASALASARTASPSALGFDGVHEAEAVTAFLAGKKKGAANEGARAFRDILTGDGNERGLPLDVLVCRDAAAAFKTTAFKTPTALEDAVFELVAAP